ncbi:hypothetical protein GOP47_0022051 [Adiantum capillus-veneris]|uniref:Uncharacterized protein n=1 Tax=Adiantum capillus-veneris TaxID=13818 RepID=A0A9D4Z6S0_ADICA|nr:hypothetical protein GOP47_0022051 [Adiantum capillus-veneris]
MAMEITCRIPDAHGCPILSIAYNKDRKEIYSGSQDAKIKVWDVETGRLLRIQQGHQAWVTDLLYSYTASLLFSCSLDGNILVWSDKGKLVQMVEFGGPVNCLSWDPKGRRLIAGGRGVVQLFRCVRSSSSMYFKSDSQNQRIGIAKFLIHHTVLYTHKDVIQSICTSDLGNVFTTGFDRCICIFDSAKPGESIIKLSRCHEGAISSAAYDKDLKVLVSGAYDGSLKLWSHEGHCLDTFNSIIDCVTSIAYIPQTKCYWVTGKARYPIIIDALAPANVTDWVADTCSFRRLPLCKVFHASDTDVAIGLTTEREIIVWRYNQFGPHHVLQGHSDWVEAIVVAHRKQTKIKEDAMKAASSLKKLFPDLNPPSTKDTSTEINGTEDDEGFIPSDIEVYSGGGDGALLKWQTDRTSKTWALSELGLPSQHSILCMLHYQKLDVVITGSDDCKVRVWNLDGHPSVPRWKKAAHAVSRGPDILRGHTGKIMALAVCKDDILVSGSYDKSLRWWDLNLCLPLDIIEMAHDLPVRDLEYCEKRNELASCAGEPRFKLWNARKRKKLKTVPSELGDIIIVKWCNLDGGHWVTASDDGTIALWDPKTSSPVRSICYRKEPVTALLVDEVNMLLLASMQSDYAIRAYQLDLTGEQVCVYTGHTEQVHSLAYLSNRNQYLSGSWDNSIRIWLAPLETSLLERKVRFSVAKIENKELTRPKDADFLSDVKYVSNYEREHPLLVPKQLQDIAGNLSSHKPISDAFLQSAAPPPSSRPNKGELVKQPALVFKLADLEKSLNDQIV